jgi:hypothetical protein
MISRARCAPNECDTRLEPASEGRGRIGGVRPEGSRGHVSIADRGRKDPSGAVDRADYRSYQARLTRAIFEEELDVVTRARNGEYVSDHHITGRLRSRAMATADILRDVRPLERADERTLGPDRSGPSGPQRCGPDRPSGLSGEADRRHHHATASLNRSRDFEALRVLLLEIAWYWLSRYENRHVGINYDLRAEYATGRLTEDAFKRALLLRAICGYKDETIHRTLCAFVFTLVGEISRIMSRAADVASRHAAVVLPADYRSIGRQASAAKPIGDDESDGGAGMYIGQPLRELLRCRTRVANEAFDRCRRTFGGDTPYFYTRLEGVNIACPRIGMSRGSPMRL